MKTSGSGSAEQKRRINNKSIQFKKNMDVDVDGGFEMWDCEAV